MLNITNHLPLFKISFLILLISTFISCKSIANDGKSSANQFLSENAVEPIVVDQQYNPIVNQNSASEATTQKIDDPTNQTEAPKIQNNPVTIIPLNGTDGAKRNERTVYHLRAIETPSEVIENFRNKLKSARNHLQEVNRKGQQPKYYRIDSNQNGPLINGQLLKIQPQYFPNQENLKSTHVQTPAVHPPRLLNINVKRAHNTEQVQPSLHLEVEASPKQDIVTNKPVIATPILENNPVKQSELITTEVQNRNEATTETASNTGNTTPTVAPTNDTVASPLDCSSEVAASNPIVRTENEELDHLLHMREEINKLRNIMKGLKEHQIKQKIKTDFIIQPNLTAHQHEEFSDFVKNLKQNRQTAINAQESGRAQDFPVESADKIAKDVSKLKELIQGFTKRMEVNHLRDENFEKLQEKLKNQQEEIENLRKQVKTGIPISNIPSDTSVKPMPTTEQLSEERTRLRNEFKHLQESLNDIMVKEEDGDRILGSPQSVSNDMENPILNSEHNDHEMETLLDLFHVLAKPSDPKLMASKLDKLERDLDDLDTPKPVKKQESILEKLKEDLKKLQTPKTPPPAVELNENIEKLENGLKSKPASTVQEKLAELEKQIKEMSEAETRALDVGINPIEKELNKLQKKIDELSPNKVNPEQSDAAAKTNHSLKDLFLLPSNSHSSIKHPAQPPIFALPFCLQPNTQSKYPPAFENSGRFLSNFEQSNINQFSKVPKPAPVFESDTDFTQQKNSPICTCDILNLNPKKNIPEFPYPGPVPPLANIKQLNYNQPSGPNVHRGDQHSGPIIDQFQPIKSQNSQLYNGASGNKPNYNIPVQHYESGQSMNYPAGSISNVHYGPNNADVNQYIPIKTQDSVNYNAASGNNPNYNIYDMNIIAKKDLLPHQSGDSNPDLNHSYHAQSTSYSDSNNNKNPYSTDEKSFYVKPVINSDNNYKSTYENYNSNGPLNVELEIQKLGDILEGLNAKINKYPQQSHHLSGHYRKKRSIDNYEDKNLVENVQQRLDFLKEQVKKIEAYPDYRNDSKTGFDENSARTAGYYSQTSDQFDDKNGRKVKKVHKFDKLFIKVLKFILHKLQISAPYVVESLFDGDAFTYEYDDDDDDNYGSSYRSAGLKNERYRNAGSSLNFFDSLGNGFQGFPGLLGFIPTILFKLLSNFSFFLNILKRNKFFNNFLIPGALILVVDGIMALLIWWFSQDDTQNSITCVTSNQNYNNPGLSSTSYNSPLYSNNINKYS